MEIEIKVENYLKERFGPKTRLNDMKRLGEGVHGAAYLLKFSRPPEEHRLIMKSLFPLLWLMKYNCELSCFNGKTCEFDSEFWRSKG